MTLNKLVVGCPFIPLEAAEQTTRAITAVTNKVVLLRCDRGSVKRSRRNQKHPAPCPPPLKGQQKTPGCLLNWTWGIITTDNNAISGIGKQTDAQKIQNLY